MATYCIKVLGRMYSSFFSTWASNVHIGNELQISYKRSFVKQLSSVLKWTRPSQKTPKTDADAVEFESRYFVETLVEGNKLGVVPHTIMVIPEGELFTLDSENNNLVKITPPLSQYSRARLVAGLFQGYSRHVDGVTIIAGGKSNVAGYRDGFCGHIGWCHSNMD